MVSLALSPPVILGLIAPSECLPIHIFPNAHTHAHHYLLISGVPQESLMVWKPLVLCAVTATIAGSRVSNPPKQSHKIPSSYHTVPQTPQFQVPRGSVRLSVNPSLSALLKAPFQEISFVGWTRGDSKWQLSCYPQFHPPLQSLSLVIRPGLCLLTFSLVRTRAFFLLRIRTSEACCHNIKHLRTCPKPRSNS